MDNHILLAYSFDSKGGGTSLSESEVSQQLKNDKLAWVHLDARHEKTKEWLETEISYLDPFIVEALLVDETRPRMMQIGDGILVIFRGVNLNENSDPEDMVSIRLWIDSKRIISLRKRKFKAIEDIEDKIKLGIGPKDAGDFICMLSSELFQDMEPVLNELDETTDDIEEQILEDADSSLRESIVDVRKKAIIFRRYMAPQRDAINHLSMCSVKWLKDNHKRYIQEVYNHVTRYVEDLDAVRERAQIIKDELANIVANKLNRNMYVLSVIAAIFLPLGFLTGLLGVNISGIPGATNVNAFSIFCGVLLAVIFVQIFIFKKFKWF